MAFLPKTPASMYQEALERGAQHERDARAIELESDAERDSETDHRPGVLERVKDAVERIPHPKG